MKEEIVQVLSNVCLAKDIYLLKVRTSGLDIQPGEFANIQLPGYFLRRPISIHDVQGNVVSFLYKVLGHGTEAMTHLKEGDTLDVLFNLGNGFDLSKAKTPLLIGGGIGIAPLYYLARQFQSLRKDGTAILGFRNKEEVCLEKEFSQFVKVIVLTDDGSYGEKGNPVSYLKSHALEYDHYYACGPSIMLKYLTESFSSGEVSLEARMGCGFGACMGCSIETKNGVRRICKEGPVFEAGEVSL